MKLSSQLFKIKQFNRLSLRERFNYLTWKKNKKYNFPESLKLGPPVFKNIDKVTSKDQSLLEQLTRKYLAHQFDILGSGWMPVFIGMPVKGFYGAHYELGSDLFEQDRAATAVRWPQKLKEKCSEFLGKISEDYALMEWHRDLRSGYLWPLEPAMSVAAPGPYIEIKSPWELARCYHLPQLALSYRLKKDPAVFKEFKNQIYDFMAQNPVGFGVNWICAMEVSIRVCNWIMAYDLFTECGGEFSSDFNEDFSNFIYQHGKFVLENLEWTYIARSNHYLSNLTGLTAVFSRLESSEFGNTCLNFCFHELEKEINYQFYEDGGNYESSASYHRLSFELVIYAQYILQNLSSDRVSQIKALSGRSFKHPSFKKLPPISQWGISDENKLRLAGAQLFCESLVMPKGEFLQIGDGDSGRLFKLDPSYNSELKENHLKMEEVLKAYSLIESKVGQVVRVEDPVANIDLEKLENKIAKASTEQVVQYSWDIDRGQNVEFKSFDHFGLYIFTGESFWLSFRCGKLGQNGVAGHDHNDQLSVGLNISGRDYVLDPGSYVYTSYPEMRNNYRSVQAHFTPQVEGREPGGLDENLFQITKAQPGFVVYQDECNIVGRHKAYGYYVYRWIQIRDSKITIVDFSEGKEPLKKIDLSQGVFKSVKMSYGYGVL